MRVIKHQLQIAHAWHACREMTEGKLVGIRKSMRKFEVANRLLDVEVCSVAKVMPCTLNRQVMMALLSRGLDEMVLWNKYLEFVRELDYLLDGGEEALMVRLLRSVFFISLPFAFCSLLLCVAPLRAAF